MPGHTFETQLSNRDFFIRRWELEHPAFIEVFKALAPDKLEYRPHPASRSAGELVALLVSLERSCLELCASGKGSYNSRLRLHPVSGSAALDAMISAYEQDYKALVEKL